MGDNSRHIPPAPEAPSKPSSRERTLSVGSNGEKMTHKEALMK